jgi:hypothetical protein
MHRGGRILLIGKSCLVSRGYELQGVGCSGIEGLLDYLQIEKLLIHAGPAGRIKAAQVISFAGDEVLVPQCLVAKSSPDLASQSPH